MHAAAPHNRVKDHADVAVEIHFAFAQQADRIAVEIDLVQQNMVGFDAEFGIAVVKTAAVVRLDAEKFKERYNS